MTKLYHVDLWGSYPDHDNDDCWTGVDFGTFDEANEAFENPETIDGDYFQRELHDRGSVFIVLSGPNVERTRRLRSDRKKETDEDWRREVAMEAGMLHGVDAYNEVLGY